MQTIVYLIRHSTPEPCFIDGVLVIYGPETPLSAEGQAKARRLAHAILGREGRPLDALYASPITRAAQTAAILAAEMGLGEPVTHPGLRDTDSTWAGTPVDEFMRIFRAGQTFADPRSRESLEAQSARILATFQEILLTHTGECIGLVSHGDPLRELFVQLRHPGAPLPPYAEIVQALSLETAQAMRVTLEPAGLLHDELIG